MRSFITGPSPPSFTPSRSAAPNRSGKVASLPRSPCLSHPPHGPFRAAKTGVVGRLTSFEARHVLYDCPPSHLLSLSSHPGPPRQRQTRGTRHKEQVHARQAATPHQVVCVFCLPVVWLPGCSVLSLVSFPSRATPGSETNRAQGEPHRSRKATPL